MTVYQGKKPAQSACKYEFGSLPHHKLIQKNLPIHTATTLYSLKSFYKSAP